MTEREPQVAFDSQVVEEPRILEHIANCPLVCRHETLVVLPDLPVEDDAAARRRLESGDDPEQRRLARAARTENCRDFVERNALADLEREARLLDGDVEDQFRHGPYLSGFGD